MFTCPKIIKLLLLLLIIQTTQVASTIAQEHQEGWFWQYPKPQGNTLNDIFIFDQNTAIAVGDMGTIIKTTDGGESWDVRHHVGGTSNSLNSVWFIDNYIGWMVDSHVVFKTTDGGEAWFKIYDGTECTPSHVHFIDENTGFVFGRTTKEGWGYGVCCKTTNGGKDWTCSQLSERYDLRRYNSSFFINSDTGWVVGDAFGPNVIYKTTDCGETWVQKQVEPEVYGLHDIYFIDDKNGFIVGWFGAFLKTNDGGNTWQYQNLWEKYQKDEYQYFYSVCFTDLLTGWIVGPGFILKTIDGGENWTKIKETGVGLLKIRFVEGNDELSLEQAGWIVGGNGIIYRTVDGSDNWIPQRQEKYNFNSIYFVDENIGWALGDNIILSTKNGGNNWLVQHDTGDYWLRDVYATDPMRAWVVGGGNKTGHEEDKKSILLQTTDGGQTWFEKPIDKTFWLSSVYFINDSTGWIVGTKGTILKTINGGESWEFKNIDLDGTLHYVYFVNESIGWILPYRGNFLLKTIDGGENWNINTISPNTILHSFFFENLNTGWIVGDYIDGNNTFKTTDGGETWTPVDIGSNKNLYSVYFVDENTGWIAEGSRYILKTTDGGETWDFQRNTPSKGFSSLYFVNSNTGWAVGYGIFKTTTGGDTDVDNSHHSSAMPQRMLLFQNYPNPFNSSTTIHYRLSKSGFVSLKVYDLLGREVNTLVDKWQPEGEYKLNWDANGLHSGVYFCRLKGEDFVVTRKLIFVK